MLALGEHHMNRFFRLVGRRSWLASLAALTLAACNNGGTAAPLPVVSSFTATPPSIVSGGSATLAWTVSGATSLSIDHGVGTVTGTSIAVTPTVTTTYTLAATNDVRCRDGDDHGHRDARSRCR